MLLAYRRQCSHQLLVRPVVPSIHCWDLRQMRPDSRMNIANKPGSGIVAATGAKRNHMELLFRAASVAALVALASCAGVSVTESYAPDGRRAYAIDCSGDRGGWNKCYSAAGNSCGAAGYDIVDRTSEDVAGGTTAGISSGFFGSSGKSHARSLVVACKVK